MPNIISNAKSLEKDKKKHKINLIYKKKLKKIITESLKNKTIAPIYKALDSRVSKRLISKNKCNKLKSKYSILIQNSI